MNFIYRRYKLVMIFCIIMFLAVTISTILLNSTIWMPILSSGVLIGLLFGIKKHKITLIGLMHRKLEICIAHETATKSEKQRVKDSEVVIAEKFISQYFWTINSIDFQIPKDGGLFIKTKNNIFNLLLTPKEEVSRIIESDCD